MNYSLQLVMFRIHRMIKRLRACSILLYFILLENGYITYNPNSRSQYGTSSFIDQTVDYDTESDTQTDKQSDNMN